MSSNEANQTASTFLFDFERDFDHVAFHSWMVNNWTCVFWFTIVYLVAVFAVSRHMSTRPPFDLRRPLVMWSVALAVFSIAGAARTVPELVDILRRPGGGWTESICNPSFYDGKTTAFWAAAFTVSKVTNHCDYAYPRIFMWDYIGRGGQRSLNAHIFSKMSSGFKINMDSMENASNRRSKAL
jgi:GNS1/SUR4 family